MWFQFLAYVDLPWRSPTCRGACQGAFGDLAHNSLSDLSQELARANHGNPAETSCHHIDCCEVSLHSE